jgi:hypothetical protein
MFEVYSGKSIAGKTGITKVIFKMLKSLSRGFSSDMATERLLVGMDGVCKMTYSHTKCNNCYIVDYQVFNL